MDKLINFILLVLVNGMWAAQYSAYKTASNQMGPVTVSAWTFLFAALILLPFLIKERIDQSHAEYSITPLRTWGDLLRFVVLGVVGLVPASAFLAWGTERSTASNAALIYLTIPILTAVLANLILGERMTWIRWLSLAISLAGVLLLSRSELKQQDLVSREYLIGNVLVLIACCSSSFYNVYCKELLARFSSIEVLVYSYLVVVVVSIPLLVWVEPLSLAMIRNYTLTTWFCVLVLSVMSWGLAMVLWLYVLNRIDVSQASVSIYLLPFLGVLIAAVTLHERISWSVFVGGLITLAGALMITVTETTAPSQPNP